MSLNIKKTEALRCGRLRDKPPPSDPSLRTQDIQWQSGSKWVRLLGIPFWEVSDRSYVYDFFLQLYRKAKAQLAGWKHHHLTNLAKARVVATMYASKFRHWYQCLLPPDEIHQGIIQDLQAFIWSKEYQADPEEVGASCVYTRWMKGGAQYGNRRLDLGLGSLPWDEHCKAIRARWIFRYLDATRSEFKYVLDAWFARTGLGRAAVFSTVPIESLTKSTTYRQPALPPFWKRALCDFRELKIVRFHPRIFETAEEALALLLWDNPLFPIKQRRFIHSWREALGIWRIRDTINESRNTILDCDDMIELLTDRFRRAGANSVYASAGKAIPLNTLIRQWDSITSNIPSHIALVARRITTPKYLVYGIGARMLRMAGWREGESLGTRGGVVEPVVIPPANKHNRGLGFQAADVQSCRRNGCVAVVGSSCCFGDVREFP